MHDALDLTVRRILTYYPRTQEASLVAEDMTVAYLGIPKRAHVTAVVVSLVGLEHTRRFAEPLQKQASS